MICRVVDDVYLMRPERMDAGASVVERQVVLHQGSAQVNLFVCGNIIGIYNDTVSIGNFLDLAPGNEAAVATDLIVGNQHLVGVFRSVEIGIVQHGNARTGVDHPPAVVADNVVFNREPVRFAAADSRARAELDNIVRDTDMVRFVGFIAARDVDAVAVGARVGHADHKRRISLLPHPHCP